MRLETQRHLFSIPREICYLNAAYMTPQTIKMQEAGHEGIDRRANPWVISEQDFFTDVETVRALFAPIIDAQTDDIAIIPGASYGVAVAARNIKLDKGQVIVMLAEQFPSNVYSWQRMAAEKDLQIKHVPTPSDGNWTDGVMTLLDEYGEQVGLLTLPHCHWSSGALLDVQRISARAKTIGAKLVLDLTQSVPAQHFSVQDVDPDYVIVSGYKWMMCPYSISFLYVAPRNHDGVPLEENWINRLGSENFAGLVQYQDAYQPGARRFDMGERASFNLMKQTVASLEQFHQWGIGNMQDTIGGLANDIAAVCERHGYRPVPKAHRSNHLLGVSCPTPPSPEFLASLRDHGVYLSVRGTSLRIAPHMYNDQVDIVRLEEILASI